MAASDVINGLISEVTAGASVEQTPSLESASFTAMISAPQFVNIVDRDPSATGIQTEAHVEMGNRSAEALGRLMFSEAVGMGQAMMLPQYAGRPTTAEFSPEAHEYAKLMFEVVAGPAKTFISQAYAGIENKTGLAELRPLNEENLFNPMLNGALRAVATLRKQHVSDATANQPLLRAQLSVAA